MDLQPGHTVIVPIYKSLECLPNLYRRLTECMAALGGAYEIILVEDGGNDGSWEHIQSLAKSDGRVKAIKLSRNYGQHNALLCGIRAASMETIITIDDDLQNPPEEIPKLLAKLRDGFDVVYGTPDHERHGFLRNIASVVTKLVLQGAMGASTARKVSAFRVFRTRLRVAFDRFHSPFLSIDVLLTWGTSRFAAVSVQHDARVLGASHYTVTKLLNHAMNMVTGFSTLPLRLASWVGFAFTFLGMLVLVFVVGRYLLLGGGVPGFPFLASIIAIFSGAQLFALGVMGEYLARMHSRSMAKPAYVMETAEGLPAASIASTQPLYAVG
ncbi:MAG: glycosyl transferase family 2 [Fibrobacteres bacterium]|nr:glycosyl transferase family 2 [Fibrobacterota bacterium]